MTVYSRRGAWMLGGTTLVSLIAAGFLLVTPEDPGSHPSEPDGYNRSAIGHSGLLRWLETRGEKVEQWRSNDEPEHCGLLVFAEPSPSGDAEFERVDDWIHGAFATLLVLGKRRGWPDVANRREWIREVSAIDEREVGETLSKFARLVDCDSPGIVRTNRATNWRTADGLPAPDLTAPAQLLKRGAGLEPLIECDQGVLLGTLGGLHVLADPDLIQNHGLVRGRNAELVLAILAQLRGQGPLVFDETLHGAGDDDSIWKAAGRFPLVLVPVHLLLLAALVTWIANGRHGPAVDPATSLRAGKEFLIANIAALLRRGGHHGHAVRRYARLRVRRAADAMQLPRSLPYDRLRQAVLERMTPAARERFETCVRAADGRVSASRATDLAREIRTSTQEVHDGSR